MASIQSKVSVIFFLAVLIANRNEAQTLSDILPISSLGFDHIYASARDSRGSLYVSAVASSLSETTNIHDSTFNYTIGNPGPNAGCLLIKFDPVGGIVWVQGFDWVNSMVFDKDDNLFVTGSYNGGYSFMAAKLSPTGNIIWHLREGASGLARGEDIIVDDVGNCYVTGVTNTTSLFGLIFSTTWCCTDHDFVIKIDPAGKLVWIKASALGTQGSERHGFALAFNTNGNIVVGGTFRYEMQWGPFLLNTGIGYDNIYLAELSPSAGDILWLKEFGGGTGQNVISDLVIDASGNIYFAGGFTETATFQDTTIFAVGEFDFFIAKQDAQQNLSWVKSMGSIKRDKADYILKTKDGIIVSGLIGGNATLGNSSINDVDKTKAVITRISSDGKVEWLKGYGYALNDDTWQISFRMGYTLNAVSDNCFFIAGDFTYDLVTPERTLSAHYINENHNIPDSFTGIISTGKDSPPILGPDVHLTWCDSSVVNISLKPMSGANYWESIKGKLPTIDDSKPTSITVSGIDYGVTVFKLIKGGCATSHQLFSLTRLKPPDNPVVQNPNMFCSYNVDGSTITVAGDSISWYHDAQRKSKISDGNTFHPSVPITVYVTTTHDGCESLTSPVNIIVNPRPAPPLVMDVATCENNPTVLGATGTNLKWYKDETTNSAIGSTNEFNVNYPSDGKYQMYVTQTMSNCESDKATINIIVKPQTPPPLVVLATTCENSPTVLGAKGTNLKWYESETSDTPLHTANDFIVTYTSKGKYKVYVTQTVNNCESDRAILQINVSSFDMNDIFLSNVVTSNGDGLNDQFYVKSFDSETCLGDFLYIKIINRWGEDVFHSTDRSFKWDPINNASGVYFYSIRFGSALFNGPITVLK